jgi:hypothetical protein
MNKSATRYRKVRVAMWGDRKFRELSVMAPSGQALWVYLLTGPHTSQIPGIQCVSVTQMAERLHWSLDQTRACLAEIVDLGMARFDHESGFLYLPKAIEYDPPHNPNVVRSWGSTWAELTECDLKLAAYAALREFITTRGESYLVAFDAAIDKPDSAPRKRKTSGNGSGNGSPNASGNDSRKTSTNEPEFEVMGGSENPNDPCQQRPGKVSGNDSRNDSAIQEQEQEQEQLKSKVKSKDMSSSRAPRSASAADVLNVFEFWQRVMSSPRSKLDDKRRALIVRAIGLGYTPDELKEAIRGCSRSPFHMGDNDRQTAFNGLDLILRSADKIDTFRQLDAHPPVAQAARASTPRLTADERRREESDRNMRDFLGGSRPNGRALPDDPFTIDMDSQ